MTDFQALAESFIEQIRSTTLTADMDVVLVYHCINQANESVSFRFSATPQTTIRMQDQERANDFAASLHLDTTCSNIRSMVGGFSGDEWVRFKGQKSLLQVQDVSLEIISLDSTS